MTDAELAHLIREHAFLEGDFLLRSGRRSHYYLDKYRFETQPVVLGELGRREAPRRLRLVRGGFREAATELAEDDRLRLEAILVEVVARAPPRP
ncbi:MAG: hypothetical protein M3312_04605 [Actinomycetota bacterium]|nr:hypothetical protein [Actinomycetota bacterium]